MMGTPRVDVDKFRGSKLAEAVCGLDAPSDMVKLVAKLAALGKSTLPGWDTRERLEAEGKAAATAGNVALANELRAQWKAAPQAEMEALAREYELEPDETWADFGWDTAKVAQRALQAMELARVAHINPADPVKGPLRAKAAPSVASITLVLRSVGYDDQCFLPVANKWLTPVYDHVILDEAQDTNACQMRMVLGVLKPGGRFTAVGDRFQSIYRFRGAAANAMDYLKVKAAQRCGGKVTELTLPETYRCAKAIVAEASKLVPGFIAHPSNAEGKVLVGGYSDLLKACGPGDFVLSRANAPLAAACLKLWKMGKRAKVEGRKFGEQLLSIVSKLKARSVPDFLEKLTKWEERECARAEKEAKNEEAAESKIEVIKDTAECLRTMADGAKGLPEVTERINNLFADVVKDESGNARDTQVDPPVVLMTVHKSKGLEADRVFLLDDTFKAKGGVKVDPKRKDQSQDELFIRYVAITRARNTLVYISGLEEGPTRGLKKHGVAAQSPAAQVTGDTLQQVADAIANVRQLMEKDKSEELQQSLRQLEEKHARLTQAKA